MQKHISVLTILVERHSCAEQTAGTGDLTAWTESERSARGFPRPDAGLTHAHLSHGPACRLPVNLDPPGGGWRGGVGRVPIPATRGLATGRARWSARETTAVTMNSTRHHKPHRTMPVPLVFLWGGGGAGATPFLGAGRHCCSQHPVRGDGAGPCGSRTGSPLWNILLDGHWDAVGDGPLEFSG